MEKALVVILSVAGSYYFARVLLTLGDTVMDAGQADVQGKKFDGQDFDWKIRLRHNWQVHKTWPSWWLEFMF